VKDDWSMPVGDSPLTRLDKIICRPNSPILEIIACSVADAIAAEQGGADRLELISHFQLGGLTPALKMVDQVLRRVSIPVRVMLRMKPNFCLSQSKDREGLFRKAEQLCQRPIQGLVLGYLIEDRVDEALMRELLSHTSHLSVTFHRAFEQVSDPFRAIKVLKTMPQIDRILSNGGKGSEAAQVVRLRELARCATPEIKMLVGGGLTRDNLLVFRGAGLDEFHVGRSVRQDQLPQGAVDAAQVYALRRLLDG